jgi:predicted dehydrogenase
MKFLIAGFGSIGRRHFRNLLALGERDILLYRTHRSTLPEDELSGFPVETNLEAALGHKPDAVIISNPTALHMEVAIPAARAGCGLLLEKPVSHSMGKVDELRETVRKSGVPVLVGFHYRQHPGLQRIARVLEEDMIGEVLSAHVHWGEYMPGWHPWEDYRQSYSARPDLGGGVILTLCHPLDYMRWFLGEAESLWAFTGRHKDLAVNVEDTAEIGLKYTSGALASVHLDYNQRLAKHTLEIAGKRGVLRWDNSDGAVHVDAETNDAVNAHHIYELTPGFERNDMFLTEMRHFLAVMQGETQPACNLEDGLRVLELALAALRSAEQGNLVRLLT